MPPNAIEPTDDFAGYMGASPASTQRLTLYVPTVDRNGKPIPDREVWMKEAIHLLSRIGGGATVFPNQLGAWLDPESNEVLEEAVDIVYSFVNPDPFEKNLARLRAFLHRLGRETNQGEVGFEFDGQFFRITDYGHAD